MAEQAVKPVPLRRLLAKSAVPEETPAAEPVITLDIVKARAELADADLEVDMERLADMLADGHRLAPLPRPYAAPHGVGLIALGALMFLGAWLPRLMSGALEDIDSGSGAGGRPAMEPGMADGLAQVTWLAMVMGLLLLIGGGFMVMASGGFNLPAFGRAVVVKSNETLPAYFVGVFTRRVAGSLMVTRSGSLGAAGRRWNRSGWAA